MFLLRKFFRKLPGLPVHELTDIMTIKRKEESAPLNDDCVRAQESGTLLKKLMVSIYNYWIDDKTSKDFFMSSKDFSKDFFMSGAEKLIGVRSVTVC